MVQQEHQGCSDPGSVAQNLADDSNISSEKLNRESTRGDQSYIMDITPWILEDTKGGAEKKSSMEKNIGGARHRWELPGNYPIFIMVKVIYHHVERFWRILLTPNFLYNIYAHE